jgi:mycothiol synthase
MLAELERLAADRGAGVARGFGGATEDRFRAELAERGYGLVRHFFRMLTPLDGEIEPPHWPAGIAVRTLQPGDERAVHAATEDAFADHWDFESRPYERWAKSTFENEHFDASLNFLALDGDEIAGVCLCAQHQSGEPGYGWVMTLGVRPRWRRRGLGLALLRHAFATFRERGFDRVGLGVDGENTTGAVRLYERAGMHVAHRHDLFEKTLSGTSP